MCILQSIGITGIINFFCYRSWWAWGLGIPIGIWYVRWRKKELAERRRRILRNHFKEVLQGLQTAVRAGYSMEQGVTECRREMERLFGNKDDLVFQSLVYHPFFFIRKAHLDEELEPQLLELQKKAGKKVPQIELQTGRQSVKLALRDIWFVESEKNYLLFYREKDTRDEAIRVRMKMSEAEKKLEAHKFVRTHKGYLVNMNYVYRLREKELLLLNGKSIPVSRNYLNQVRMKIMGVVME
mgnify:CR=1 FL=1